MKVHSEWHKQKGFISNINGIKIKATDFTNDLPSFCANELHLAGLCETAGNNLLSHLKTSCHLPKSFKIEAEMDDNDSMNPLSPAVELHYLLEGPLNEHECINAVKDTQPKNQILKMTVNGKNLVTT